MKLTDLTDQETMLCFPYNALFSIHAVSQYAEGQHKSERRDQKKKRKIKNLLTGPIDERSITKF